MLRFFAFKNRQSEFKHEVEDFLTDYMEAVADAATPERFDFVAEEENFKKTFEALNVTLAEYSFALANRAKNPKSDFTASFGIYHFESITIGLQSIIAKLDLTDAAAVDKLARELKAIKLDQQFIAMTTGGGKNSPGLLKARISYVAERLTDAFP